MRDRAKSVEGDDIMSGDGLKTNGALAVERTMVAAGSGGVVTINPGVSIIRGVLLAADEVCCSNGVGREGCAKSQNKRYASTRNFK